MALADIITKIDADAAVEAERIVAASEERAQAKIEQTRAEAEAHRKAVISSATHDAVREASRVVAAARLAARDEAVERRRALVDEALAEVAKRLAGLPDREYLAFLAGRLAAVARGGERVRFGKADAGRGDQVLAEVSRLVPGLDLSRADESAPFERGALVEGTRVRADLSLEAIVEDARDELELVVSSALFPKEASA